MLTGGQKKILLVTSFAVSFLLFVLLIVTVVYVNYANRKYQSLIGQGGGEVKMAEGTLFPDQVLNNKANYHLKRITLRGKVSVEPVVCEKKTCPVDDNCCGCPANRDLVMGGLKLLDSTGKQFCLRIKGGCKYDCRDWVKETIYDVSGQFYAEPPPSGWKMSLNHYFLVDGKTALGRLSFGNSLSNLFKEIKGWVENWRSSGAYVLTE